MVRATQLSNKVAHLGCLLVLHFTQPCISFQSNIVFLFYLILYFFSIQSCIFFDPTQMQKLFGLKRGKARNAWNVRRTLNQIPGNGTTEEKHNLRNIAMSGMKLEIEDDERNRKWFCSSSKQEILSGTDFVFQLEFQFLRYTELPLTTEEWFFTFVKTPSTWMTCVTNWKVSINQNSDYSSFQFLFAEENYPTSVNSFSLLINLLQILQHSLFQKCHTTELDGA